MHGLLGSLIPPVRNIVAQEGINSNHYASIKFPQRRKTIKSSHALPENTAKCANPWGLRPFELKPI
jgi:hypothetical protein